MIALEPVTHYLVTIIYSLKSKLRSVKGFTLDPKGQLLRKYL